MKQHIFCEKERELRLAILEENEIAARNVLKEYVKKGEWFLEQVI
jgi:hypothetical protein